MTPRIYNILYQYGCEPGQIIIMAHGLYTCLREDPERLKPKVPEKVKKALRSEECRIAERKSSTPYPGMSATIKCQDDQGGYALYNPKGCRINYFGTHPTGKLVGTKAYPLIEDELVNAGCAVVTLDPIGPRAQKFWERQGYKCVKTFGGHCLEMAKKV
jgi:hypothetical protein